MNFFSFLYLLKFSEFIDDDHINVPCIPMCRIRVATRNIIWLLLFYILKIDNSNPIRIRFVLVFSYLQRKTFVDKKTVRGKSHDKTGA